MELIISFIQGAWNTNWILGTVVAVALIATLIGVIVYLFNNLKVLTILVVGVIIVGGGYKVLNSDYAAQMGKESIEAEVAFHDNKNILNQNLGSNNEWQSEISGSVKLAFGK